MSIDVFKWILALIGGGMILLFFLSFSGGHVKYSKTLESRQLVEFLDDELRALGMSEESSTTLTLEPVEIGCGDVGSTVLIGGVEKELGELAFGDKAAGKTILWSRRWMWPYFVGTFYYVIDRDSRYAIVTDSKSITLIEGIEFPEGMHVRILDDIGEAEGGERVLIVTMDGDGVAAGRVAIQNQVEYFFGEEMLIGSLVSKQYGCMRNKAVEQFVRVGKAYQQKVSQLMMKTDESCRELYLQAKGLFEGAPGLLLKDGEEQLVFLSSFHSQLESVNDGLGGRGCPAIYET